MVQFQAFDSSRLDYCNSVFAGVSSLLQKMQVIQNAAARFDTGARRRDHMTSVLRELHWLPVRQRIGFKTAVMMYKCIHGLAPSYLAAHCKVQTNIILPWSVPSAIHHHVWPTKLPRTKTDYGKRSFAVNGQVVWTSLPTEFRSPDISMDVFKAKLKTFLFNC